MPDTRRGPHGRQQLLTGHREASEGARQAGHPGQQCEQADHVQGSCGHRGEWRVDVAYLAHRCPKGHKAWKLSKMSHADEQLENVESTFRSNILAMFAVTK